MSKGKVLDFKYGCADEGGVGVSRIDFFTPHLILRLLPSGADTCLLCLRVRPPFAIHRTQNTLDTRHPSAKSVPCCGCAFHLRTCPSCIACTPSKRMQDCHRQGSRSTHHHPTGQGTRYSICSAYAARHAKKHPAGTPCAHQSPRAPGRRARRPPARSKAARVGSELLASARQHRSIAATYTPRHAVVSPSSCHPPLARRQPAA
jgi:hypothetical protein